ncbi:MAG: hypothetical protein K6E86_08010 [Bacteroidales bacterium]|nr:hypothetical protein [Bacteroidales bacterium]
MAKIQIKPETITPLGGIFPIMDDFNRPLGKTQLLHRKYQQESYALFVSASKAVHLQCRHLRAQRERQRISGFDKGTDSTNGK